MSNITTEICKNHLIEYFKKLNVVTAENDWKRTKKYKNEDGFWLRDFQHPILGSITILEDTDSQISVYNKNLVKQKNTEENTTESETSNDSKKNDDLTKNNNLTSEFVQKVFTSIETSNAKKLLKKYIDSELGEYEYDEDEDDEEFVDITSTKSWQKYSHALPSQFKFYFPNDFGNNNIMNVKNGIDSPMFWINTKNGFVEYCSFNVAIIDKNNNSTDSLASYIFRDNILPNWIEFIDDESHLEVIKGAPPKLTVKEFFKLLLSLGFEYDSSYNCLFSKQFSKLKIEKSFFEETKPEPLTKDAEEIKKIISKDKVDLLEEKIRTGLDLNLNIQGYGRLLTIAAEQGSKKCLTTLINNKASLLIDNGDGNTVLSTIFKSKHKLLKYQALKEFYKIDFKQVNEFKPKIVNILTHIHSHLQDTVEFERLLDFTKKKFNKDVYDSIVLDNAHLFISPNKLSMVKEVLLRSDRQMAVSFITEQAQLDNWKLVQLGLENTRHHNIFSKEILVYGANIREYVNLIYKNLTTSVDHPDLSDEQAVNSFIMRLGKEDLPQNKSMISDIKPIVDFFGGPTFPINTSKKPKL